MSDAAAVSYDAKCPKHVQFGELPETPTGKIQKFRLREAERREARPT